jgi:pyruvate/2-oxoglutarate/acetoin dehydrogenase E1 component
MTEIDLTAAIDAALGQAMADDQRILIIGEDVPAMRRGLLARFGPDRVLETPISESAFLGAGVGAALGGLCPVVEIMFVDFLSVALSQLANEAAMIGTFSGGRWSVPLTIRSACGGGYGDAGQHEQALWGQLAAIPGVVVAVPSIPSDAAGLTLSLLGHPGPSVLLEHKLLSAMWRDELGGAHRRGVDLGVPTSDDALASGRLEPVPLGRAAIRRHGADVSIISVGVGVHRAIEAATRLAEDGIDAAVVDLRTVAPLDVETVCEVAGGSRAVLVVDEDYTAFGLSGEIAAVLAENGITRPFARVATSGVIPYARHLELETLPSVDRILQATRTLTTTPFR